MIYERMTKIFAAAGFVQVGENAGYTFKPWNDYSKIDYIFLFKAGQTFKIDFQIAIPADLTNCKLFYTDHKALIMDLEWQ